MATRIVRTWRKEKRNKKRVKKSKLKGKLKGAKKIHKTAIVSCMMAWKWDERGMMWGILAIVKTSIKGLMSKKLNVPWVYPIPCNSGWWWLVKPFLKIVIIVYRLFHVIGHPENVRLKSCHCQASNTQPSRSFTSLRHGQAEGPRPVRTWAGLCVKISNRIERFQTSHEGATNLTMLLGVDGSSSRLAQKSLKIHEVSSPRFGETKGK